MSKDATLDQIREPIDTKYIETKQNEILLKLQQKYSNTFENGELDLTWTVTGSYSPLKSTGIPTNDSTQKSHSIHPKKHENS